MALSKYTSNFSGNQGFYFLIFVSAFFLSWLIYQLLPFIGIGLFRNILGINVIWQFILLVLGLLFYIDFLKFINKNQSLYVLLTTTLIPILIYLGEFLRNKGINLHVMSLLIPLFIIPASLMSWKSILELNKRFAYIKCLLLFLGVVIFAFLFNNINYELPVNIQLAHSSATVETGLSKLFLYSILFECLSCILATYIIYKASKPEHLFTNFNSGIALYALSISLLPLFLYNLGIGKVVLEGVSRFSGIFPHPNYNGFYLGFLCAYLFGVYLYTISRSQKHSLLYLLGAVCTLIGCIFTLSKTALFSLIPVLGLISLLFLILKGKLLKNITSLGLALGVVVLFIVALDFLSAHAISNTLIMRAGNSRSLDWRINVWQTLLFDIDSISLFLGHGLTASYQKMYELLYSDFKYNLSNSMQPHNIFIQFLYDFGILGLTYLAAMLAFPISFIGSLHKIPPSQKKNYLFLAGLQLLITSFYIAYLSFNNLQLISGSIYWVISSFMYVYATRGLADEPA